jgi:demethylmenaquinone methyltransferase/2-methoxy-6-polyprenyl-1,4-benzoquinol methylase
VRSIFDRTAGDYDRVERIISAGSGAHYRRRALLRAGLVPGASVLDVGTGTGLVAKQAMHLIGSTGTVTAVDPAIGMMLAGALPEKIRPVGGSGEALPFASAKFDFLSMGYALRHVSNVTPVFAEFCRVLKPGGRLCILEITRPQGRVASSLLKFYMRRLVPALARYIGHHVDTAELMRYYWDTIEACLPAEELMAMLRNAGFEHVRRHVELGIFSEYQARRPG